MDSPVNCSPVLICSKTVSIDVLARNGMKAQVTHSFRQMLISDLSHEIDDLRDVQKYIGHKSIKSTEWYNDKKKGHS